MLNAFTIDVEDWFCSHNLSNAVPFRTWDQQESRVVGNTRKILRLLKDRNIEATFFILGWVAERFPGVVQEIADGGHEIASHGYGHQLLTAMNPDMLRRDLEKFFSVMNPLTHHHIHGYRAPAFSITNRTLWALDVLKEFDFTYDSSVFPVGFHPDYGISNAPLHVYEHQNSLIEIPLSCVEFASHRVPCSGGGYFRLYPYPVFKKLLKKCNANGRPLVFYLHPWEVDKQSSRVDLPFLQRFRHYQNIENTFYRLERLTEEFQFTSIRNLLKARVSENSQVV